MYCRRVASLLLQHVPPNKLISALFMPIKRPKSVNSSKKVPFCYVNLSQRFNRLIEDRVEVKRRQCQP
jgi:hypothetical protein